MKVLLDHYLSSKLRPLLSNHEVFSTAYLGWDLLANAALLAAAEERAFDALLTADQGAFCQQNNFARRIALMVLTTNHWFTLRSNIPAIREALARALPGSFELVSVASPRAVE